MPESEYCVVEQVANDMRSFPHGAKGEGLEQTRIGGYQVERTLGVGGMGIVLLGREPSSEQLVAIKLIRPEYLPDPARFAHFSGRLTIWPAWHIPMSFPFARSRTSPTVPFM